MQRLQPLSLRLELQICMGVSQNQGYHFGVPIMRIIVFGGLYWGPLILGN